MQPWIAVALTVFLAGSQAKEASIAFHQPTSDDDVAVVGANRADDDDESSEDGVSIDLDSDEDDDDDENEPFKPLKPQVLLIKPWSILVLTGILAVALLLISALCFTLRQPSEVPM
ncbi:MAG: uncharacterized protein KVP18_001464 [Porospora cf. gigantea A]|nr:MAG: hypothetical protein KVP18_001464 [Porospora cf. gigantea A]